MSELKKIGWFVSSMNPGQLQYDIIHSSNEYMQNNDDVDISLYYVQDGPRVIQPRFACMNIFELYGFTGIVVCTSLHTLSRCLDYPGPNQQSWIYFYDYNLDYLRIPAKMRNWEQLNSLYCHPKVKIIARSNEHADILKSIFQPVIGILPDANVAKLQEIIYVKKS